jgi:uncharacterized protein (DUF885 family)
MMLRRRDFLSRHLAAPFGLATGMPHVVARGAPAGDAARSPMGRRLMAFLAEADRQDLALDPQAAVLRGDTSRAHDFGDYLSDAYFRAVESNLRRQISRFSTIDRTRLRGAAELVAFDTWRWQARLALRRFDEGHVRFAQQMPVDHLFGQHVTFANFSSGSMAPYRGVKDYDDGLARIDGFVVWVDRAIARMREGMQTRRLPPRLVAQRVLAQLDEALAAPVDSSPYFEPIRKLPDEIAADQRERLTRAYRNAIDERIRPAYDKLARFVRLEYLPATRTGTPGVGALPGGKAWYDHQIETMTTLRIGADEIHRIGLVEVARIRGEIERTARRMGFRGNLRALFDHLRDDARYKFASSDALLDAYRVMGRRVDRSIGALFERMPRANLEIKPVPKELESSVAGASYQVGTPDGERPGVFYVNTSELPTRTSTRVTALYLHEGVPGHHLQGSLAQEAQDLPPLLRFSWNVGYGEGWALYAEQLGHEMGLYDDPVQHLGALDMEIFRAARLVVDTGLHAKAWPRERAVAYMVANTSLERAFCENEVDRYIAWPAQATGYKLGEITIRRLRRKAESALGKRFDVKRFHAQVLDTGSIPLEVLAMKIGAWIREGGS